MTRESIAGSNSFPPHDGRLGSADRLPFSGVKRGFTGIQDIEDSEQSEGSGENGVDDDSGIDDTPFKPSARRQHLEDTLNPLGLDYCKFRAAFGFTAPPPKPVSLATTAVPAKHSAKPIKKAVKRHKPDSPNLTPQLQQPQLPVSSNKRPAEADARPAKRVKLNEGSVSRDRASTKASTPSRKGVAQKVDKPLEPKGSGLYKSGNWAWVSDDDEEEKPAEKFTAEAKQISAIIDASNQPPVKTTRGALKEMRSKLGGQESGTPTPPSYSNSTNLRRHSERGSKSLSGPANSLASRKSLIVKLYIGPGARNSDADNVGGDGVDQESSADDTLTLIPRTEADEGDRGGIVDDSEAPQTPRKSRRTVSASESSFSNESATAAVEQPTRSTSRSSPPHEANQGWVEYPKPKKTWNAIIYEVVAHGTSPSKPTMTYAEIVEGVKQRYPYFTGPSQSKTLESSPRNPLYSHPAFFKEDKETRPDKTNAWGIRPGVFIDKKTGLVLTPGPAHIPAPSANTNDHSNGTNGQEDRTKSIVETPEPSAANATPSPEVRENSAENMGHQAQLDWESDRQQVPNSSTKSSLENQSQRDNSTVQEVENVVEKEPPRTPDNGTQDTEVSQAESNDSAKLGSIVDALSPHSEPEIIQDSQENRSPSIVNPSPAEPKPPTSEASKVVIPHVPLIQGQLRALSMPEPHVPRPFQAILQPRTLSLSEAQDQRRLDSLLNRNLVESFTDEELDRFIQETKICYFRNMDLQAVDISKALDIIFSTHQPCSTEGDMEQCAQDFRRDYEEHMWGSEWFTRFVTNEVNKFNQMMEPFTTYVGRDKPIRIEFWLGLSKWNKTTCTKLLSTLSDAVDVEKVWSTKHWHDFVRKIFAEAADAMWEHRLRPNAAAKSYPGAVFVQIKKVLNERYPEREGKLWDVPRVHHNVPDTPTSVKSSFNESVAGSSKGVATTPPRQSPLARSAAGPTKTIRASPTARPPSSLGRIVTSPAKAVAASPTSRQSSLARSIGVSTNVAATPPVRSPQVKSFNTNIFNQGSTPVLPSNAPAYPYLNKPTPVIPPPGFTSINGAHSVAASPTTITNRKASIADSVGGPSQSVPATPTNIPATQHVGRMSAGESPRVRQNEGNRGSKAVNGSEDYWKGFMQIKTEVGNTLKPAEDGDGEVVVPETQVIVID